jgi:hypothetical protein
MNRLALLVSVLALCAAGWLAYEAQDAHRQARTHADTIAALESRLTAAERALEAAQKAAAAPRPAEATPAADATAAHTGNAAPAPGLVGRPPPAPTAAGTLADLEKRLAALEKAGKGAAGTSEVPTVDFVPPVAAGQVLSMPKVYGTVDDAAKDLEMNDGQKRDFERIVADAQREISDLHKMRDEDGVSWEDAEKDVLKMEDGVLRFDTTKLDKFREKVIPGRRESYGAADRRLRDDAVRRMRDTLSPDQRTKFDAAHHQTLLGGDGSPGRVSFSLVTTDLDIVAPQPAMDK